MGITLLIGNIVSGSGDSQTIQEVQLVFILLSITLVVSLVAPRLHLPYTLVLVIVGLLIGFAPWLQNIQLDPHIVLFLFLPILLFEGAWNAEIEKLAADWLPIFLLAVPGLLIGLAILALALHLGINMPWPLAVLLGATVSPTDPLAAIPLLRQLGMAERLRTVIEGESLFNDGVGVAVFEILLGLLLPSLGRASIEQAFAGVSYPFLEGAALWLLLGGPILGLLIGWLVARFLFLVDNHLIETTATLIVAYGSYLLGNALHTSGLLAVVGAGLVIGSYGRNCAMSQRAQEASQDIWEFLAYLTNSLLFLMLGMQIGASNLLRALPGICWAVGGIIVGRFFIIYLLIPPHDALARRAGKHPERQRLLRFFPRPRPLAKSWRPILVLVGLRGALSIALVLSLPTNFTQHLQLESIVYGVVLVTLLGQGLALRFLLPHWPASEEPEAAD